MSSGFFNKNGPQFLAILPRTLNLLALGPPLRRNSKMVRDVYKRQDSAAFLAAQETFTSEQAAQDILTALDLTGSGQAEYDSASAQLVDSILSMSLPAETRLALLELHKNYRFVMQESVQCLYTAYAVLEDMGPKLQTLTDSFTWEIHTIGSEAYTQEISNFHIDPNVPCRIQPLLMLPATYLSVSYTHLDVYKRQL